MNYSFWKLLRRQWSWKNDKICILFLQPTISILMTFLNITFGNTSHHDDIILTVITFWSGTYIVGLVFYHTSKLVIFTLFCWLVTSEAKKGNDKAVGMYDEMWNWRQ